MQTRSLERAHVNRPGFLEVMEDAEQKKIDLLVAKKRGIIKLVGCKQTNERPANKRQGIILENFEKLSLRSEA